MIYIDASPNPSGAYPGGKNQPFPGCIPLTDAQEAVFRQYNGFVTISEGEDGETVVSPNVEEWEAWKAAQPDPLDALKSARIAQSKTDLAAYLSAHPLQWTDGEYYSITAEKQQQLTSKIMAATMAQTLSESYTLTWNSTGEVCREWNLQDLSALAFAIDARVTSLVSYQQTQEVSMRNAETQEDLEAITVDYDSVPMPGGAA